MAHDGITRRKRQNGDIAYVVCPATITSPAPSPEFMAATGLGPNESCGLHCPVQTEAPTMSFRCQRGHYFLATPNDIQEDEQSG